LTIAARRTGLAVSVQAPVTVWPVVVSYAAALVPLLTMAVAQPVWSRVDEAQHADVLAQYQHGVWPVEGTTLLRPEIVAEDAATGVYRWNSGIAGPRPVPADPDAFSPAPADATPTARMLWFVRHVWGYSYEAMQPPLYYLAAEPAWSLGIQLGGVPAGIYTARIFSALLAALLAPLTYLLIRVVRPDSGASAWIGTGFAVLTPGYIVNTSQITNDGLAAALGAGLLVLAAVSARDGWTAQRGLAAGALLGGVAMTKLIAAGLGPFLLLALLWPGPQPYRERLRAALLAGLAAVVVALPWLIVNVTVYGQPIPSRATQGLLGEVFGVPPPTLKYLYQSAHNVAVTFWTGEPYRALPFTRQLTWVVAGLSGLVGAGLVAGIVRQRRNFSLPALLAAGTAVQTIWVLASPYVSHVGGMMPGRYLYPVAAAIFALYGIGLAELPSLLSRLAAGAGGLTALAAMTAYALTPATSGSAPPVPTAANKATPVAAHAGRQAFSVDADRVYVLRGGREAWVHLTLSNRGLDPVELSPIPAGWTVGQSSLHADSKTAEKIPERLEPGDAWSGWIRLTRSESGRMPVLLLHFSGVTADGYHTAGPLDLLIETRDQSRS
jgi:hypothetical protein